MIGELRILNVGTGDTKITFDKDKPGELDRARRTVQDMLKLGYSIVVKVGEKKGKAIYRRAVRFDEKRDEYIVRDIPTEAEVTALTRRREGRIPAASTQAVSVARSAGGMSERADSVERQNMELFDDWSNTRHNLHALAQEKDQWAGLPMPLNDMDLIVEPRYALASAYKTLREQHATEEPVDEYTQSCRIRSRFYSVKHRRDVVVWEEDTGRVVWAPVGRVNHFEIDMQTMAASVAWGVDQEAAALQLLATLLPHHAFKKYLLSGMFVEQSQRSRVFYFFRRLRPTVAVSTASDKTRILCILCQHPIAYYANTFSGAMCPTDDVIAHLVQMRGDEHLYWRRCNQHPAYRAEAGL